MSEGYASFLMTRDINVAQYVATILMLIRREFTSCPDDFRQIIQNERVVDELQRHFDYYHMYDYHSTIEELAAIEPLIKVNR